MLPGFLGPSRFKIKNGQSLVRLPDARVVGHTISPASAFPIITQPVFIDGYTETGASADSSGTANDGSDAVLQIMLNGSVMGASALDINGLHITGGGSTVRGLVINNWDDDGMELTVGDARKGAISVDAILM